MGQRILSGSLYNSIVDYNLQYNFHLLDSFRQ